MKIICVDDEQNALDLVCRQLGQIERVTEVEKFLTPESALAYLSEHEADVALLDINMRSMDGLSLAKLMREQSPRTRIIFLTGYSQYALEAFKIHADGYLMKPATKEDIEEALDYIRHPVTPPPTKRVQIQCFGNFEVFADGEPIHFKYSKTKELLAYLVDRKGAAVNSEQICAVLWEDKPNTQSIKSYLRNLFSDLNQTLKEADAQELLIKSHNSFAVAIDSVDCDYYRFLRQDAEAVNAYCGEYMAQYSWAEMTLAMLEQNI